MQRRRLLNGSTVMKRILLSGAMFGAILFTAAAANAETVLVDMKGPGAGNPFWAAVEEGAKAKGKELGVEVRVMSPPQESDVAKAKGIPVVFIDTKGSNAGVTFIGTNNETGAALAAEHICKSVPKGSEVAILQGIITQSTGQALAQGSKAGLEACGMKVVAEQPADWDRAKGQSVMENILTGNPNIKAVFASNDNMALGAIEALKAANKLKDVLVVGFDANPDAAAAVLAGDMSATVAQSPKNM